MAHKKGGGSSTNGRDSQGQRLGIKRFGGQAVTGGSILIRQRGTHYKAGRNVGRAKDDSLFALINGIVLFEDKGEEGSRKVAILFEAPYHCAVLDVEKLTKGDIDFGSNSWRGDNFEEPLRKAIRISSATTNTEGA